MSGQTKAFYFVEETRPGDKWLSFYQNVEQGYLNWFMNEGDYMRPTLAECEQALATYMPELLPLWKQLCELTQADDLLARMLSLYCPAPYVFGCSQAVWSRYSPVLVRNYDYSPNLCEGRVLKSKWHDTEVIASTDCLWGALDGMNEHGLCVSLAFGGSDVVAPGFGMPLVVRYVLEFCQTTQQALDVLSRVPINMAYNITLVDAWFHTATIELSPIMPPKVSAKPFAVNHQQGLELSSYALFSNSTERKQILLERLYSPMVTLDSFIDGFEYAPLFSSDYDRSFGTLYTAVYNPTLKAMEWRWPYHVRSYQSFEFFTEQTFWVRY